MTTLPLYLAAAIAVFMFLARLLSWRYRVRQVRRRRARRGGYLLIFDQEWEPRR